VVVEDYNDYFSLLQQEKDKQKEALQLLLNHLTKIIMDTTTSSDMIKQAKYDKSMILSELKHLL
jgi:cellobiose-specific phosphotransferase system component IIA